MRALLPSRGVTSCKAGRTSASPHRAPATFTPRRVTAWSSAAPKTGQHTVEDALRDEALALFFRDPAQLKCTPTSGGVNNVVQYIDGPEGRIGILRVYNNGLKSEKVRFEHEILRQLQDQTLSFDVPCALPSLAGRRHELLSSGTEACVFKTIPGTLAKTTTPQEVGRASGELCTAMSKVKFPGMENGPIAPYFRLFHVHHTIAGDAERFYSEVATNAAFDTCREAIDYLVSEIRQVERKISEFQAKGLPMQLIHGDLHYDNVMVVDDRVSGLLDFEFCSFDWRAMELAVALSKYVGEAEPLPLIEAFVAGFVVNGQLDELEASVIPDLINLRVMSNVVYFTSRAIAKEDSIDSLTSRAGSYAKRVRWVNANRDAIVAAILSRRKALSAQPVAA